MDLNFWRSDPYHERFRPPVWISTFRRINADSGRATSKDNRVPPLTKWYGREWHRTVKAAIKWHATEKWCFLLPIVLLGLRAAVKNHSKTSPTEMVFGSPIHLPGEYFPQSRINAYNTEFVKLLRRQMQLLKPNVFVRSGHVRPSLETTVHGPIRSYSKKW